MCVEVLPATTQAHYSVRQYSEDQYHVAFTCVCKIRRILAFLVTKPGDAI